MRWEDLLARKWSFSWGILFNMRGYYATQSEAGRLQQGFFWEGRTEPGFDLLILLFSLERHRLFCPCVFFISILGGVGGWVGIKCFTHGKLDGMSKEGYAV